MLDKLLSQLLRIFLVVFLVTLGLLICGFSVVSFCGLPSPDGQNNFNNAPGFCNVDVGLFSPLYYAVLAIWLLSFAGLVINLMIWAVISIIKLIRRSA